MKALRLVPLVLILAACSSVNVPLSPYRIDVQQGNALEQESVEKLKPGLTRSQVRFLLGTPLVVDPFHGDRWDYVYNFRKAGKLAEERRLTLFFEGDVLARIEAEGLELKGNRTAEAEPAAATMPQGGSTARPKPSAAQVSPIAVAMPLAASQPLQAQAVEKTEPAAGQAKPGPAPAQMASASEQATAPGAEPARALAAPAASAERDMQATSIVPPLPAEQEPHGKPGAKPVAASAQPPEPVALQAESNVEAIRPDVMPDFPNAPASGAQEGQLAAALNAWVEAWRKRDEEAYFAAYAPGFRPAGGQSREMWEKRRRLLLGVSRNIDLQTDGLTVESMSEDRAQVSFRQFYRSDSYRDAVIKQLVFVRVDSRWLIEEENVLSTIKGN